MSELILAPAHIGNTTKRRYRIRERIGVGTPIVDLSGKTVEMLYKGPKDKAFTVLTTPTSQLEILDATNGIVRFNPATTFFNRKGEWKWYFRVSGTPRTDAPEAEMIVIEIKDGKV